MLVSDADMAEVWEQVQAGEYSQKHNVREREVEDRWIGPADDPLRTDPSHDPSGFDGHEPLWYWRTGKLREAQRRLGGVKLVKPQHPRTVTGLKDALAAFEWAVRFNVRTQTIEVREDGRWEPLNDGLDATMRTTVAECILDLSKPEPKPYRLSIPDWDATIKAIAHSNQVEPFTAWLAELPAWDGVERIDTALHTVFGGVEDTELMRQASRMCFIAPVERALKPGCRQDTVVVLVSKTQATGKSTFIRSLAGPLADDLFSDSLDLSLNDKQRWEATGIAAVVEASELQGWTKADLNRLKNYITRRNDRLRPAYARHAINAPRRFALFGSTNDAAPIPNDPSGARRFLAVGVERGEVGPPLEYMNGGEDGQPVDTSIRYALREPRRATFLELCYAEALEAVDAGETANVPPHLEQDHRDNGRRYRDADEAIEEPLREWLASQGSEIGLIDAVAQVPNNVSSARVARALRNLGWTQHRTKKARIWRRSK